ncbi:MAG TPA: RNase adapter RapZ [Sphingobacteriaceae bacterium]|nr:RNase adapter RapZ [Sphingobacteriaceae bacterium]
MTQGRERNDLQFLIITGLSGAGKTLAIRCLEDLGFFCVDNMPPALLPTFAQLCLQTDGRVSRAAVVMDVRGGAFFDRTVEALDELDTMGISYQVLFLEADEATLVRRFKETRRRHPMVLGGRIADGIAMEARRLEVLRGRAHRIIDTSSMTPGDLARRLSNWYADPQASGMTLTILTFGFKHGLPMDADLVLDVRFLPNPYYVPSLRPLTGNDQPVKDYVLKWPITHQLLERLKGLLDFLIPQYVNEGKAHMTIAIGCTGGRHRSVVIGNMLWEHLRGRLPSVTTEHRDVGRPPAPPDGNAAGHDGRKGLSIPYAKNT